MRQGPLTIAGAVSCFACASVFAAENAETLKHLGLSAHLRDGGSIGLTQSGPGFLSFTGPLKLSTSLSGDSATPTEGAAAPVTRPRFKSTVDMSFISYAGGATSNRLLDDRKSAPIFGAIFSAKAGIWSGLYFKSDFDLATRTTHGGDNPLFVRDAYFNYSRGPLDLRVGDQVIAWGRTDVINPTDNLTPFRYTWLATNDADQRIGSLAISVSYRLPAGRITAISLPLFIRSAVPLGNPSPFSILENSPKGWQSTYALKYDKSGANVDWSLSYFQGHSLRPDLAPSAEFPSGLELLEEYPRVKIIGGDFAAPVGSVILRGESAYTLADDCCSTGGVPFRRRNSLFTVLGTEASFISNWRLIGQLFHKYNFDNPAYAPYASPLLVAVSQSSDVLNDQLQREYLGFSTGLYESDLSARLTGGLDAAYIVETHDFSLRPRVTWTLSDSFALVSGIDWYNGTHDGPLGRLHENTLGFVVLRYSGSRHL